MRETDAAALEQVAVLDDARETAATERGAGRLLPGVCEEGLAVETFEGADDALLEPKQVLAHRLRIDELRCQGHAAFKCRPMKPSTVSYQATMLRGFRIQWFSSGKISSSLGTPWYCRASKRLRPSLIGQR